METNQAKYSDMHKKMLYLAPAVIPLALHSEGVVCQSGNFGIDGFTEDGEVLGTNVFESGSNLL